MKPFLQGRKTLSIAPLRAPHAPVPQHLPNGTGAHVSASHAGNSGWAVEVIKEGDKVTRILVTCACGERTEITCLYPAS
jgi:hypothetical protein